MDELLGRVGSFLSDNWQNVAKTGIAALSSWGSYEDQKRKNELQRDVFNKYMDQGANAAQAAEAAIAANLTPMVVSGAPTTKAEVTDYTAATGLRHGGISNLRKGYASRGFVEDDDIEIMDEEVVTPFDLKMEEGVNIGEQVFYNTGRGDRANALMIWDQMSTPDKSIFDFDFEIFFNDGGWRNMIKGQAPMPQGETQMASNEANTQILEQLYDQYLELGLSPAEAAKKAQEEFDSMGQVPQVPMDQQGIMQAAQGGRIGYRLGTPDTMIADQETILETPNEEIVTNDMEEIQGQTASPDWYIKRVENLMDLGYDYDTAGRMAMNYDEYRSAMDKGPIDGMKKGGRAGYRYGDQVGITAIPRPVMDPRGLRSLPAMATKDGMMDLGGLEKDYRFDGGFVPIGAYEKKDDVPARLSKNEFVFTADAVRAAGGGSINKGAKRMYETMKNLEAKPEAKRMTA